MTKIPTFDCGSCTACCTVVPFTRGERDRVAARHPFVPWERLNIGGEHYAPAAALKNMRCPFVVEGKGCSVYDIRPLCCRLYGSVDHPRMACAMGRGPRRKLTEKQADRMIYANKD